MAKNSSGEQTLYLTSKEEEQEFWFTLCGEYEGNPIQIDFDTMTRAELENLSVALQLVLEAT
jgi:hypothetical protein